MFTRIRNHTFVINDDNKVMFGISEKGWHEEIFMIDANGNEIFAEGIMSINTFRKLWNAKKIVLK